MTASEGLVLAFVVNAALQATVVALAAMAAAAAARPAPAAVRQAIWMLALALALAIPLRSTLVTMRTPPPPPPSIALPVSEAGPIAATKPAPVSHAVSAPAPRLVLSRGVARALVAAYLLALVLRVVSLLRGWARARRLSAEEATALPPAWARRAQRCASALGVSPAPIVVSWRVEGPATVGAMRPVIVLPRRLLDAASPAMAAAMLCHEMAHVRRRDYAWNLACEVLALPLAFHPAAALIRRKIRKTREQACDELAAAVLGATGYARALVALGRSVESGAPAAYAVGMLDHSFEERVMRLLGSRSSLGAVRSGALLAASGLVLALGAGMASAATATVAVAEQAASAPSSDDAAAALLARDGDAEPGPGEYVYAGGAKRDPFMDLRVHTGKPTNVHDPRAFLIQEVALRGVVSGPKGWTAMVLGPDGRTYFVSAGQVFYDATLTAVDASGMTVQQHLRDPLAPVRVRELRIALHPDRD
jgi:beta-lactamase regulating signal transducer with metallopeptidase domain